MYEDLTIEDIKNLMQYFKITGITKVNSKTRDKYIKEIDVHASRYYTIEMIKDGLRKYGITGISKVKSSNQLIYVSKIVNVIQQKEKPKVTKPKPKPKKTKPKPKPVSGVTKKSIKTRSKKSFSPTKAEITEIAERIAERKVKQIKKILVEDFQYSLNKYDFKSDKRKIHPYLNYMNRVQLNRDKIQGKIIPDQIINMIIGLAKESVREYGGGMDFEYGTKYPERVHVNIGTEHTVHREMDMELYFHTHPLKKTGRYNFKL